MLEDILRPVQVAPQDPVFQEHQHNLQATLSLYEKELKDNNFYQNKIMANRSSHEYLLQIMKLVYPKNRILFCVDVEAYEFSHDIVSEIGVCVYDPRADFCCTGFAHTAKITKFHLIIKENMHYRNGRYVKDNQDNFLGGPSYVMPMKSALMTLQLLLNYYFPEDISQSQTAQFGVSLVGHDVKGDVGWLTSLGLHFPSYMLAPAAHRNGYIIDTQVLWRCSFGSKYSSLKKILTFFDIPNARLHNGGNDALFTLILLLVLTDPALRRARNFDKINEYFLPEHVSFGKRRPLDLNVTQGFTSNRIHVVSPTTYNLLMHQYVSPSIISDDNIKPNIEISSVGKAIQAIFENYH